MKLFPKKTKYKKEQKGKSFNRISKVQTLDHLKFGSFGLKALTPGRLTSKQLLTIYNGLNKVIKKNGRIIMRVFPHTPVTSKPIEVRMGKGKGYVNFWIAKIFSGTLLCEVEANSSALALKALKQIQIKIPLKTKILISL